MHPQAPPHQNAGQHQHPSPCCQIPNPIPVFIFLNLTESNSHILTEILSALGFQNTAARSPASLAAPPSPHSPRCAQAVASPRDPPCRAPIAGLQSPPQCTPQTQVTPSDKSSTVTPQLESCHWFPISLTKLVLGQMSPTCLLLFSSAHPTRPPSPPCRSSGPPTTPRCPNILPLHLPQVISLCSAAGPVVVFQSCH